MSVLDSICEVAVMTVEELMREALRRDPPTRAGMAHKLFRSLESLSDCEARQLWADEAVLRSADLDAGTVSTVSAEDGPGARACDEPPHPAP